MTFKHKSQKHLPPLSKYARKLCDDLVTHANACRFSKPSSDFKNDVTKTKAIDCGQHAASSKQPPCPQALSPDVGCFVDSPSPRKGPAAREGGRYEGSLLDDVGSPRSSQCGARSVPSSFDLDVDNILNLSPGGDGRTRAPPCEKRCPLSAEGTCLNARTMEEDGGYLSYHAEEQPESKDPSVSAPQQPRQASRSQLRLDCHAVGEKNLPESVDVQGPSSRQHSSFLVSDLEIMSGGPRSEPPRSPRKVLDSPVEELWNVGLPVLQSSLCHSPSVSSVEKASQAKCVSEGVMELLKEDGESHTSADTDAESPLQVRVKSVVVTVGQRRCTSERAVSRTLIKRVEFDRDLNTYLSSVAQHMKAPQAHGGVMVELSNLMSRVADQSSGPSAPQWQHPSDLTCRNYSRRFATAPPAMSLREWQERSSKAGKRFSQLPAFERRTFH